MAYCTWQLGSGVSQQGHQTQVMQSMD